MNLTPEQQEAYDKQQAAKQADNDLKAVAASDQATKFEIGLRALSQLPRRQRREVYRRYLKSHGVPKPRFPKFTMNRNFNRLNYLTFLEEIAASYLARKKQEVEIVTASTTNEGATNETV